MKSSVRNFCFLIAITFLCCAKANAASATLACFEEKENAQKLVDKTEFNEEKEELDTYGALSCARGISLCKRRRKANIKLGWFIMNVDTFRMK